MGFLDDIKNKAEELGEKAGDAFEVAKDKAGDLIDTGKEKAGDLVDAAKDKLDSDNDGDVDTADASQAFQGLKDRVTGGGEAPADQVAAAAGAGGAAADTVAVSGAGGRTNGLANFSEDELRERIQQGVEQARASGQLPPGVDPANAVAGIVGALMGGPGGRGGGGGGRGGRAGGFHRRGARL